MIIKFKKLVPEAQAPFRKHDVDAGFDLYAVSKEETKDYIEYKTGIAVEIPDGYVGLIFPRSSVTNYDLMLKNGVGVIDASYRGEIRCRFAKVINELYEDGTRETLNIFNGFMKKHTKIFESIIDIIFLNRKIKTYDIGDRVAQIVFIKIPKINLVEVLELSDTERGEGGFGSTNK